MKSIYLMVLTLCAFTILGSSSCENLFDGPDDDRLKICNNSNTRIYNFRSTYYPDTTFCGLFSNPKHNPKTREVNSGECKTMWLPRRKWEHEFENRIESDTLLIFIFDAEILDDPDHDWESTCRDHTGILRMYKFSYDDLENMDWTIDYP